VDLSVKVRICGIKLSAMMKISRLGTLVEPLTAPVRGLSEKSAQFEAELETGPVRPPMPFAP
jgi:hypothetical protein